MLQYRKYELKISCWFLFFSLFFSTIATSQRFAAAAFAGINFSQIDGDQLAGYHQIGANAGLQVYTSLSDRWELVTGMGFSQLGSNKSVNDPQSAALDQVRLNYVEVPALLSFNEWKFKVSGGLLYSRLINYKAIDYVGADVTDLQNWRDNALSALVGVSFVPEGQWVLDFRWFKAFTDLQADSGAAGLLPKNFTLRGLYFF